MNIQRGVDLVSTLFGIGQQAARQKLLENFGGRSDVSPLAVQGIAYDADGVASAKA